MLGDQLGGARTVMPAPVAGIHVLTMSSSPGRSALNERKAVS
jgi:hypothetical protein